MKIADVIHEMTLFSGLDNKSLSEYSAQFRLRSFSKDEIIAAEGDACTSLAVIVKGGAAMQKYTPEGDYVTIGLLREKAYFGEELLFGKHERYACTLEAVMSSEVLFIPSDVILSLMEKYPVVKENYMRILSERIHAQNMRIAILAQKGARQKIAYYLLMLLHEQGDGAVHLPGSKEVIAKLLSMPRPSFSRELLLMEKEGILHLHGKEIEILDKSRLETDLAEK